MKINGKEVYFIVWKYENTKFGGGGYHVGYLNAKNDKYTSDKNIAYKYKTLKGVIVRLEIEIPKYATEMSEVRVSQNIASKRNSAIASILGEEVTDAEYLLANGYAEYFMDGKFMGRADELIVNEVKRILEKQLNEKNKKK